MLQHSWIIRTTLIPCYLLSRSRKKLRDNVRRIVFVPQFLITFKFSMDLVCVYSPRNFNEETSIVVVRPEVINAPMQFVEAKSFAICICKATNTYGKRFRLYKLHGSIDHFWSNYNDGSFLIKIPWGIDAHEIHREFKRDEKLWYEHNPSDVVPEFLSGTTQKIARYERGPYYPRVLEHFVRNLEASNTLIVIGYGFRDERINQYLEKLFLDNPRKSMIVVDVVLPKNPLMNRENVHFINGGVSGMDIRQVLARIIP